MEKWLFLLGITGLFLFLMRRGGAGMGCCGGGHSHGNPSKDSEEKAKENSKPLNDSQKRMITGLEKNIEMAKAIRVNGTWSTELIPV